MTQVNPQGNIYLCHTPLEADYKNQLTFANANAQASYFASTVVKSFDNNTYIRKDGGIKVDCNIDEIRTCNYMYYRNTGFSSKIYYCFITSMEYLSEDSTLIRFDTDCFQTWYFDLVYKPCFIEREHVADDTIGKHTVPEGLETGDMVVNSFSHFSPLKSEITWPTGYEYTGGQYLIAFQVTELVEGMYSVSHAPQNYNGVYSGLYIVAVDSASDAQTFIDGYASENKSNAIVSCFITYPHFFNAGYSSAIGRYGYQVGHLYPPKTGNTAIGLKLMAYPFGSDRKIFETLNNFTPKNNKLRTYPYCAILADNNGGSTAIYKPELFENPQKPQFSIFGGIGQGNSIKLVPYAYNFDGSIDGNYQEGLQAYKLPVCAFKSDYYLNWATQNAVNMTAGAITSPLSGAISGAMTGMAGGVMGALIGAGVGATTSGLFNVINNIAKTETAKIQPDTARGNVNVSDLNIGYFGQSTPELFSIKTMSIKAEYAKIIDDFFTMFGYKINEVKTPQFNSRTYWNYVKTVDCNVEGDIPQEDLQIVRNMFNKGCTFWHGASNMYNYNLNNSIVS